MKKKQINKALKRRRHISTEEVHPSIAAGLTQGVPKEEALSYFPERTMPEGVEVVRHMRDADRRLERGRDQFAAFVIEENPDAVIQEENTGRVMHDVVKTYTREGMRLLQQGRQCLRCDEPQLIPFPERCPLCGYAMHERQVMDIAMEFVGSRHIGPSRPLQEFLDEQELRMEKRRFIDKQLEGGGKKIPREWLHDAHLFPKGPPAELLRG